MKAPAKHECSKDSKRDHALDTALDCSLYLQVALHAAIPKVLDQASQLLGHPLCSLDCCWCARRARHSRTTVGLTRSRGVTVLAGPPDSNGTTFEPQDFDCEERAAKADVLKPKVACLRDRSHHLELGAEVGDGSASENA